MYIKLIKSIIIVFIIHTIFESCTNMERLPFKQSVIKYNRSIDTCNSILIMHFDPFACMSCNSAVFNIIKDKKIKSKFGGNVIWLFNNIRNTELKECVKNFEENVSVKGINYCNDSLFYKNTIDLIDNKRKFALNDAYCLVYNPFSNKLSGKSMRESDIVEQILKLSNY